MSFKCRICTGLGTGELEDLRAKWQVNEEKDRRKRDKVKELLTLVI